MAVIWPRHLLVRLHRNRIKDSMPRFGGRVDVYVLNIDLDAVDAIHD